MRSIPSTLCGARMLRYSLIDERHELPTEYEFHYVATAADRCPVHRIAICEFGDKDVHLFGCDADWNVLTNTWHISVEDAMCQAESEYGGISKTWQVVA